MVGCRCIKSSLNSRRDECFLEIVKRLVIRGTRSEWELREGREQIKEGMGGVWCIN
jgi:hypothetical protein